MVRTILFLPANRSEKRRCAFCFSSCGSYVVIILGITTWALSIFAVVALAPLTGEQTGTAKFAVDYREVMIPMRDGVRLQTVIVSPRDVQGPLPILFSCIPFEVSNKQEIEKALAADPRPIIREPHSVLTILLNWQVQSSCLCEARNDSPTDAREDLSNE